MASSLASHYVQHYNLWRQCRFIIIIACSLQLIACSSSKYISRQSSQLILSDTNFQSAHVGISIYDPSSNKYLYTHQAEKYFIPASNTKLFTCYAAMKHLGDSLVGLRYLYTNFQKTYRNSNQSKDEVLVIMPAADPSFLHPDFKKQPVYDFLRRNKHTIFLVAGNWNSNKWGFGWTLGDYLEDYMPERNDFPVYGNIINASVLPIGQRIKDEIGGKSRLFKTNNKYFDSLLNENIYPLDAVLNDSQIYATVSRSIESNFFRLENSKRKLPNRLSIPFVTNSLLDLLKDTLSATNFSDHAIFYTGKKWVVHGRSLNMNFHTDEFNVIYSQPTDSLLKPMMHRSDNFFAEQTLLMVSNEMTGVMNDAKIIDSLLKTDVKDLPQKPRWVDGSGLSRYNLFSPNDMVAVLNKMKNEFDWNRITTILPTGGEGTLGNYYLNLKDKIFAKTGTLSNNIALSGFLITKQNKTLIFSVLVNNHMGNTTQIRKAVEKFLTAVSEKY